MNRRPFKFLIQDGGGTPRLLHTVSFEHDTTAISFAVALVSEHDICEVRQGDDRIAVVEKAAGRRQRKGKVIAQTTPLASIS